MMAANDLRVGFVFRNGTVVQVFVAALHYPITSITIDILNEISGDRKPTVGWVTPETQERERESVEFLRH